MYIKVSKKKNDNSSEILLSIIVPVYRVEEYIEQCVESLLNQGLTSNEYEIILVDDGSPDRCGIICDEYAKSYSHIRVLHKKNGGLSDARNYGICNACGKYVLFVDSDDYIEKGSLKKILEACEAQNYPEFMFLQAIKLYPDGTELRYDQPFDLRMLKQKKEKIFNYLGNRDQYPAAAWVKLILKSVLIDNGIIFKKGQLSEDYEWSFKLYKKIRTFGCYNGKYYYYRQNRMGSITSCVNAKHFFDLISIIESLILESNESKHNYEKKFALGTAAYVYRTALWSADEYYDRYGEKLVQWTYLLNYRNSRDIKMIRYVSRLFGLKKTVKILRLYRSVREKCGR